LYAFIGCSVVLANDAVRQLLSGVGISGERADQVLDLLFWFGFLGVMDSDGEERYAYQFQYGIHRMLLGVPTPLRCVVHPAFRHALGCSLT
jgi:hypothetical protein